jgi:ATP-dependent DNA helicase RecQ
MPITNDTPPDQAAQILKTVFGYDSFRPLQRDVIDTVLSRRDTLAVMPTGGGKSICYQVPALIFPGLTIVLSRS